MLAGIVHICRGGGGSYTEVLNVGEDLVIESKVIAGDDIDTGILLDLPVGETETLGLSKEVGLRYFASPVWKNVVSDRQNTSIEGGMRYSQASVAFFRSRFTPIRGNPRTAD